MFALGIKIRPQRTLSVKITSMYAVFLTQATFFWNSLTNDNAFRQTYLGGMHFSNIRVYEDNQDLSYLNFLEANKLNFGVPA